MKFIGQGLRKDVLAYPLHVASVYRSCSSVPDFVVSLPCPTLSFRRASALAYLVGLNFEYQIKEKLLLK